MLHLIFQSPLQQAVLQRIAKGDAVLFLENAVIHLLKKNPLSADIDLLAKEASLFVLTADLETRGISTDELVGNIKAVGYTEWVDLTLQHHPIQSWF